MEADGWEIRPAGWILFFVVVALLIHYVGKRLRRPPDENPEKPS
jgi:hypothetical protein